MRPKLYLAGPDVFRSSAKEFGNTLKQLLDRYGFDALWPFDNDATTGKTIFQANIEMIKRADGIVANVVPFRGPGVDDGTAYEIGFASALSKPIFLYTSGDDLEEYKTRVDLVSPEFPAVEDFGLKHNLMIVAGGNIPVYRHIVYALQNAKEHFARVS